MGFFYGFLCGLLFIPFSILAGLYYFFNYSESYAEQRQEKLEKEALLEREQDLDLDDMPSSLYASYISQQRHGFGGGGFPGSGNGLPGSGLLLPEHLDPQYQFAGWISVKRIPEVDHRIIEPSVKKENKKHATKNGASGQSNGNRKGSQTIGGGPIDEPGRGAGVAGSMGAGAAQDPRFTYLDTQNPHLSLPPCLQARFKDSKYGVVKGATMFIYENELMQECLGVITLPNYQISVPGQQKDSHIFSKRHPIWLKYSPSSTHSRRQTAESDLSLSAKDYYLSMVSCVDKEDLYFTLLRCAKLKTHSRSFLREIPKRVSFS
ncbi:hypothetical protein BGZ83_010265 [Gryganskiella cystojenkinii]|nr:hypothetical protein BGZ83_010265 [Gryganskiella cystojenkinii]